MAGSRYRRKTGTTSYRTYVARLRSAPGQGSHRNAGRRLRVFAATCAGSEMLSRRIGLPLAFIGLAHDPGSRVAELATVSHGSLVPLRSPSGFAQQAGWDDWSLLHLGSELPGIQDLAPSLELRHGAVEIARHRPDAGELAAALASLLTHLRLHELASRPAVTAARVAAGGPVLVKPRYTSLGRGRTDLVRVDDLFAFDARRDLRLLCVRIEAALADVAFRQSVAAPSGTGRPW